MLPPLQARFELTVDTLLWAEGWGEGEIVMRDEHGQAGTKGGMGWVGVRVRERKG